MLAYRGVREIPEPRPYLSNTRAFRRRCARRKPLKTRKIIENTSCRMPNVRDNASRPRPPDSPTPRPPNGVRVALLETIDLVFDSLRPYCKPSQETQIINGASSRLFDYYSFVFLAFASVYVDVAREMSMFYLIYALISARHTAMAVHIGTRVPFFLYILCGS